MDEDLVASRGVIVLKAQRLREADEIAEPDVGVAGAEALEEFSRVHDGQMLPRIGAESSGEPTP
jgi:hypothetical protein